MYIINKWLLNSELQSIFSYIVEVADDINMLGERFNAYLFAVVYTAMILRGLYT